MISKAPKMSKYYKIQKFKNMINIMSILSNYKISMIGNIYVIKLLLTLILFSFCRRKRRRRN